MPRSRLILRLGASDASAPRWRKFRNRRNRPDAWESKIIEEQFRSASYEKNKPFAERADYKGTEAYRFILPEYYGESCLSCHGQPKGERDITGGMKEGGKLGELGGAISLVILD